MSAKPFVTVILPTYNWASVLPYSIGSVLWQAYTDFELLVVGDHCTDDSERVVNSVSDSRVQWLNLCLNYGHQYGPNNEGLAKARGSVIAYLGHDDLWLPHYLESQLETLDKGADLAFAIVESVFESERGVKAQPNSAEYRREMWIPPTGLVHRKTVTETVGGWRSPTKTSVAPETDLWTRSYDAGYRVAFTPRLGAVKFPASWRKGVYRSRPSHEQAFWFKRISNERDFEVRELARLSMAPPRSEVTPRVLRIVGRRIRHEMKRSYRVLRQAMRCLPLLARWRRQRKLRSIRAYKGLDPR